MASQVKTTLYVNGSNPTNVAVWKLSPPSTEETTLRLRLNANPETLGPDGDHRVQAAAKAVAPGGKYRAVCKLNMQYVDLPGEHLIATGWLIAPDLIATAGHVAYDRTFNGGFLKSIEVLFGYHGPESIKSPDCIRVHGAIVAAPSEFLKAQSYVHDVSFIRLSRSLTSIIPIAYEDTPDKGIMTLGVVGYPGDRGNGCYLYEHFVKDVKIDLAETQGLLTYKIDTTGGQSGSPVLTTELRALAVHVAGGYPNVASPIGPIGNVFGEYIAAIDSIDGTPAHKTESVPALRTSPPVSGFQLISVRPTHPESYLYDSPRTRHDRTSGRSSIDDPDLKRFESALALLGGKGGKERVDSTERPETPVVSKLRVFEAGHAIIFPKTEAAPAPASVDEQTVQLANKAAEKDIATTLFINFTPDDKSPAVVDALNKVMDSIQLWQCWASTAANGSVQAKVDSGDLERGEAGQMARSSYRAMIFDFILRQSPCFILVNEQNIQKKFSVKKLEFHTELLTTLIQGLTLPTSVFSGLEKVLTKSAGDFISLSSENASETTQYWIMLTQYQWLEIPRRVETKIQTVGFQVSGTLAKYGSNKASYESLSLDMSFSQAIFQFNSQVYEKISGSLEPALIEAGKKFFKMNTFDIPVPKAAK